jgi:hypothetical protein
MVRFPLGDEPGHGQFAVGEPLQRFPGLVTVRVGSGDIDIIRRRTVGESNGSPAATRRIARTMSGGGVCLSTKPLAPARIARRM